MADDLTQVPGLFAPAIRDRKALTVSHALVDFTPIRGRIRDVWKPSWIWLAVPGLAYLAIFFLWPTIEVLLVALRNESGAFDHSAVALVFKSPLYSRVLLNTFAVALQVTLICLLVSYPLAYWVASQKPRRQRLLMMLILLPFWTSALVKNFAWLVILGRNGLFAQTLVSIGVPADRLLYNKWVVLFGIVHTLVPLCVIAMMPAVNQINRALMPAAATLGADPAKTFWRVFLPLSLRGVATSGLMVFITTLGFFITPTLLGSPRETMIGQLIVEQITEMQNLQQGGAMGLILLAGALIAIVLFDRVFGLSGIAGGGAAGSTNGIIRRGGLFLSIWLSKAVSPLYASYRAIVGEKRSGGMLAVYSYLVLAILLLPVVAIVPMAFTSGSFLAFPPPGVSLRWFELYFSSPVWMAATMRSFGIGLATAALTTVIASTVAFAIVRSKSRWAGLVFLFFMSPMIVPHLVIAIGLFYLFAQMSLIATDAGLVIGHSVIAMPVVFIIVLSVLRGHDWRLDDAALTLGASPRAVLARVTVPLVRGGIIAGFITGFLISFEELTIALFIGGGLITTLPKQLWGDILLQITPTLAAASVVVLGVVVLLFLAMEYLDSRKREASATIHG
jgi:putative spermidine/putrescine transport system permease protein